MTLGPSFTLESFSPKEQTPMFPIDTSRVKSFKIEDSDEDLDTLVLVIDNKDMTQTENPAWAKGNTLEGSFGVGNARSTAKKFIIKTAKGFPNLKVTAFETTIELNAIDKCRAFTNVKLSDVAQTLAIEAGFETVSQVIQETAAVHTQVTQAHEPDARFLKRIAEKNGFQFFINEGVFHWHERDFKQQPIRVLKYFTSLDGDIIGFKFEDDTASKPGEIEEKGINILEKKAIAVTANNKETIRTSLGSIVGVYDKETSELHLITKVVRPTAARTETEAKEEVDGKFKKSLESQIGLEFTMHLTGDLPAKTVVRVEGIGSIYSGNYYIKKGTHTIKENSGRSVFKALRNAVTGSISKKQDEGEVSGDKNETETPRDPKKLEQVAQIGRETGKLETTYRPVAGKT